jgi:hypothetical protein
MNVLSASNGRALGVLAVCIVLLAGCATAPPQEVAGPNDPAAMAAIRQAYMKLAEQKTWRMRMTSVSDGKTSTSTASFVQPDRFHLVSDQVEQIHVAGAAYMKVDGKWQKLPLNFGNIIEQYRKDPALLESSVRGATSLGKELVDGKPMSVYRYYSSAKFAGGLVSGGAWSKLWVDGAGIPRKVESESRGQALGFSSMSTSTIVYYDLGAIIRINPPI